MTRLSPKPKRVKAENVHIGDTIRVTSAYHDATISIVGVVNERFHDGHNTLWCTKAGVELIRRDHAMHVIGRTDSPATIVRLSAAQDSVTLPGLEGEL